MTDTARSSRPAQPNHALALPNLLTYGRIVAVPLFAAALYFFERPAGPLIAAAIFAIASITDYFDGYLARIWKQQSNLGRMLDPIADKLLVSTALLMMVWNGTLNGTAIWAALIILLREIIVSGLREFLAELNVKLHVSWLSKLKTVVQMLALFVLLVGPALTAASGDTIDVTTLGLGLLWMSAILTLYTGFDYLKAALKHVS